MWLEEFRKDDLNLAIKLTIYSLTRGKLISVYLKTILLGG